MTDLTSNQCHAAERRMRDSLPCPWCVIDELKRNRDSLSGQLDAAERHVRILQDQVQSFSPETGCVENEVRLITRRLIECEAALRHYSGETSEYFLRHPSTPLPGSVSIEECARSLEERHPNSTGTHAGSNPAERANSAPSAAGRLAAEASTTNEASEPATVGAVPCVWRDGCRNPTTCAIKGRCDGPPQVKTPAEPCTFPDCAHKDVTECGK